MKLSGFSSTLQVLAGFRISVGPICSNPVSPRLAFLLGNLKIKTIGHGIADGWLCSYNQEVVLEVGGGC